MTERNPVYFATPAELREWLQQNHTSETELLVGLYRRGSGRSSITWPELVDQLLCFGWIDGVRRSIDEDSYSIRVTPRRRGSAWSSVNLRRIEELKAQGLVNAAGLAAHERRDAARDSGYSFEQAEMVLGEAYEALFRANPVAWSFFQAQPPGYRRTATWWVISAKREETRARRLDTLIADSADGRRLGVLQR